jgi:hypothetical protein
MLRLGIFLRSMLALLTKYRGASLLLVVDYVTVAFSVLLGSRMVFGKWLGLPSWDYPYAVMIPPLIVLMVLAVLRAYQSGERRRALPILIAVPAILIALSSLTYFFKEFPANRQIVIAVSAITGLLLLLNRFILRVADRIRWGGHRSASPTLARTLVVGTDTEAMRIAELLRRTAFIRRYEIAGFIDRSLARLNEEIVPGLRILGDVNMMARVVRDQRITEVIFATNSVPYAEMLAVMQRVSAQSLSRPVNFNMVPTASEVLIGKRKIELLAPTGTEGGMALLPVEYNLQRISHRVSKRILDLIISGAALPFLAFSSLVQPGKYRGRLELWKRIFEGELTLVGVAGRAAQESYFPKRGYTSLAAIAAPRGVKAEDIDQFDQYYARNHTLGMDCEILLKTVFFRRERDQQTRPTS